MKYKPFLIIFLLLLPLVQSSEEWIYRTSYFDIEMDISSPIGINALSPDSILDYVKAELFFFPKNDERQQIKKLTTIPEGDVKDDYIEYLWENPKEKELNFLMKSEFQINQYMPKIKNRIPFPVQDLDEQLYNYTQPTKLIDSNSKEIILVASSLATGRDNLYDVVFTLSDWVLENINYSINTVTEKVSQKASWVLQNKYGVCDEITTLFIALCRSLGIPAKYVGGLAYTNWNNINDFGPHAWAEVYFPSIGWVPYDITYGEFGFIDGTHIKLKEYLDPEESSTRYEWRGKDIEITTNKLDMKAKMLSKGSDIPDLIKIKSYVLKNSVGFGSYNLLTAEMQNLNNFYISTSVSVVKSAEVNIIGESRKYVFLEPLEKKKLFWIIKIDNDLSKEYIYTFPLSVYSIRNITGDTEFSAKAASAVYGYSEIKDVLEEQKQEEKKVYSQKVDLKCETNESFYYINEDVLVKCQLKNTGNVLLQNIKMCLEKDCEYSDLGINQETIVHFSKKVDIEKQYNMKISASNTQISKAFYLPINVYDRPHVEISDMDYPSAVSYKQNYKVSFLMNKTTKAIPYNIIVTLSRGDASKDWKIQNLPNSQEFIIELNGKDLGLKENIFQLALKYEDRDKYVYTAQKDFSISLTDVGFFQKIAVFLRQADIKLQSLINKIFK